MSDDASWLSDMLDAGREALAHVGDMDRAQFVADLRTQRAVELLIVIIGEAASQVSEDMRNDLAGLPWRQIIGMRNRLVHHYFKIDIDLVWDVVSNDLRPLISALESQLGGGEPT